MMPMLPFSPLPSVVNAYARVDKATSEFLNCPDWRINIGICDTINSKPWLAKDYIKGVRTRIQHKNPNVQLLSLTLLETIVKNCSEHIHVQMAERKILQEMIKIVKKRTHMRVREKILVLIDTWQEAFGSRGAKTTTQYYRAYEELRRHGVDFPRRSPNMVPVITPPIQSGAGSSTRHETLSLSSLEPMKDVLDLLSDMLQALDLKDRKSVKDEVIVDLYEQCRSNQKKLGETLSSTSDEEILRQGIQFNEGLQYVIEKHDAIASGLPIPIKPQNLITNGSKVKQIESAEVNSKASSVASSSSSSNEIQEEINDKKPVSDPTFDMALVPSDPPISDTPVSVDKKSAEEDMIDFLSLALYPAQNPNQTQPEPVVENQPQPVFENQPYVVPWAQALTQPPAQAQAQLQMEYDPQTQAQMAQQQSNYIPPPWAPTPGYYCNPYASNYSPASYYNNGSSSNGSGLNPYIPSYRLFEDLNVLGNMRTSGTQGSSGPSMVRK